jgi:hypothetical protein
MSKSLYYLGQWIDNRLYCYCQDGEWRAYAECEENWINTVVLLRSKEIYELEASFLTDRYAFRNHPFDVRSNSSQRMVYVKYYWDNDEIIIEGKVLAGSYYEACDIFKVTPKDLSYVVHISDIAKLGVSETVDSMPLIS